MTARTWSVCPVSGWPQPRPETGSQMRTVWSALAEARRGVEPGVAGIAASDQIQPV
ncbi:MAG TPA: hypothetical protein VFQ44_23590 [Streptosporangiaceae bacterium]|nr:hypothetical protein [Streptosporangiaceae bacterium]